MSGYSLRLQLAKSIIMIISLMSFAVLCTLTKMRVRMFFIFTIDHLKTLSLNMIDLSEIARNSVLQSGFDHKCKLEWLGDSYESEGIAGNDPDKTNLPQIRMGFRSEELQSERSLLAR